MIERMSVRLQSETATVAELGAVFARSPDRVFERGLPVGSRATDGPVHAFTTCVWELGEDVDELSATDVLGRLLAGVSALPPAVSMDVILMVDSRPLGSMTWLAPELVRAAADAGAGIVVDAYDSVPEDVV